jgi:hypothetical protein
MSIDFAGFDAVVSRQWAKPDASLHGLVDPKEVGPEYAAVVFPYCEVVAKIVRSLAAPTSFNIDRANVATFERAECLAQCIQRLGGSIIEYERALNESAVSIYASRDYKIDASSVISHLRGLVELLSITIPFLINGNPYTPVVDKFKELLKLNRDSSSPYFGMLENQNFAWFYRLAGTNRSDTDAGVPFDIGIRNPMEHEGAIQKIIGSSSGDGEDRTPWTIRSQITSSREGAYADPNADPRAMVISPDFIPDLKCICSGLFGFLDWLVRKAEGLHPHLKLRGNAITGRSFISLRGKHDFVASMLPQLNCD